MMPTPGPEIAKLAELMRGSWRGEEKLYPSEWDPVGGPAVGTWNVTVGLGGFAVIVDYVEERDGKQNYLGHGVHCWDQRAGTFMHYWFDNIGIVAQKPTRGTLEGTKYWYLSDDGTRMTYEWANDTMTFVIEKSSDDGATWKPMHEGRYTRSKS